MTLTKIDKTKEVYGFLWAKTDTLNLPKAYHFNKMQEVVPERIVRGAWGIDIGSGCGYDTYIMAKNNPSVKIVSMDISDGVHANLKLNRDLQNVYVIKGSVSDTPFKEGVFDFVYSFGVLHHTSDHKKGFSEIARILKKEGPAFLYLYEDHSENLIKYIAVKIISKLRRITVKISPKVLYVLCWIFSPFVFIIFSFPAKVLRKFKATQHSSKKIPFNFGTNLFSLRGDLYDRFSTPIEHRFNRQQVYSLLIECGFQKINITRLNDAAGWVTWGYKK